MGVQRRMVREALDGAMPRDRKKVERDSPSLGPAQEFMDTILEADRKAPRKQRHRAHRIWVRIEKELAECSVGESTVRRYEPLIITTRRPKQDIDTILFKQPNRVLLRDTCLPLIVVVDQPYRRARPKPDAIERLFSLARKPAAK